MEWKQKERLQEHEDLNFIQVLTQNYHMTSKDLEYRLILTFTFSKCK